MKQLVFRCKPDVLWWHTPNGGSREVVEAVNLKRMGTLSGVPDLFFFSGGRLAGVELKAPGTKLKLSSAQEVFKERFERAGGCYWEDNDLDSVLTFLSHSDLLR